MPDAAAGPEAERVHAIPGLRAPVTLSVDRWGVTHIDAGCEADLFLAQGFNAARDRLWQIDLWRKRGLGLLAADFGPGYLAQDRASRLFLYRGDMAAEWAAYGPDAKAICEAFTAGVDAFVDEIEAGRASLPPEFEAMGTRPARWRAEDVVRIRSHCLTRNAISEVLRAEVLARAGPKAEALRMKLEPAVDPGWDEGLDVPLAVADAFRLATAAVSFDAERLAAGLDDADRWSRVDALGEVVLAGEGQGSNNWAVSGARTATGRPIMAMDPHRTHAIPSVRYLVHLRAPGLDAIGAGEPSAPGISMGHNGRAAFSLTIFGADQEDVLVYDTDPDEPARYRYGQGHETMREVEEGFAVRGHPDQRRALRFTRHGPVVHEEPGRAFAIRTVWTDPGSAPYMASLSVMRAESLGAYREALRGWGAPSVNHLYADAGGTIAWQAVGATPVREGWTGLVPVPGDGRFEWRGTLSLEELPSEVDPDRGFVATANEMNLPPDRQAAGIGYEWADPSRAERIRSVLGGPEPHTPARSCALQTDLHSAAAVRLVAVLGTVAFEDAQAACAAAHLSGWDGWLGAGSSPALLCELWVSRHLKPALFEAFGGEAAALLPPGDIQSVLNALERPGDWFDGDAPARRDAMLGATLAAAWRDAAERFGDDPGAWRWGRLHRLPLDHALAGLFPERAAELSLAPMEVGGSGSSPMNATYRPGDFRPVTGPSVRMVIDVGAWDESLFVNLPGQSGDPRSPHHRDLAGAWLSGDYRPLVYTAAAVEAVTRTRIRLEPAGG